MEISNTEKLELHYFFNDESHSIDASVRHKCETEILAFISEIAHQFKVEISVDIEPYDEGGFIDKYKIKWNSLESGTKVSVRMGVITLAATILMNRNPASTSTPEMQKVNDEIAIRTLNRMRRDDSIQKIIDTKVQDSIASSNVKKLTSNEKEQPNNLPIKKEDSIIHDYSAITNDIEGTLQVYEFSKALTELEINPKINRFRSNFFKSVRKSEKITHVSTTPLKDNNEPRTLHNKYAVNH